MVNFLRTDSRATGGLLLGENDTIPKKEVAESLLIICRQ